MRRARRRWFATLRGARGWSMAETARRLGCGARHAWAIESGEQETITDAMRWKFAKAFGLSIAEIERLETHPTRSPR